jgi:hypothetical protein
MPEINVCPACGAPLDPNSGVLSCEYCGIGLPRSKRPQQVSYPEYVEADNPIPTPVIPISPQGQTEYDFRRVSQRIAPWATRLYNMYALRRVIVGCLVFLVLFSALCVCLSIVAPVILAGIFRQ